jgi:hypothetical protein
VHDGDRGESRLDELPDGFLEAQSAAEFGIGTKRAVIEAGGGGSNVAGQGSAGVTEVPSGGGGVVVVV